MSSLAQTEGSSSAPTMLRRTVAVVDMVGYSSIARILEQNISALSVAELNRQIQSFMSRALATLPDQQAVCVVSRTGDGIILLFDRPDDAHAFAVQVHHLAKQHNDQRSEASAQRWFRVGIATGDVSATTCDASPAEYAGTTIANAVRLEAAAHTGEIVLDAPSYQDLSPKLKLLYSPEITVKGKRDERFRARRFQVVTRPRPTPRSTPLPLTRRALLVSGASALAATGLAAWFERPLLDRWTHPLPARRFVALLGWPVPTDLRLAPALAAVVQAIGNELARAEAFDHNLSIIPYTISRPVTTLAQVNDIRDSLGANLVLAASATPDRNQLALNLRVLGSPPSRSLRESWIRIPMDQQLSLPERAVRQAARLLDIQGYQPDQRRARPGTTSLEAFNAFQDAEALFAQDNDAHLEDAIEKYKHAIELDARYVAAHARLAGAYCKIAALHHDPAALGLARANADMAVELDPASVPAHMALASVFEQSGDEPAALAEMKKALAVDPTNTHTLVWQADLYIRLNRWDDAEQALRRGIRERPNSWYAHNELGVLFNATGQYPSALREFQLASLAAPRNAQALNNVGSIFLQLGKIPEAIASCKRSLDLHPNAVAAASMAAALRTQQSYAKAHDFARQATQLDPDDSTTWLELGDCCSLLPGKRKEAAAAYETARRTQASQLETDATNGPGLMLLALYQAKCNPSPEVFPLVQKADAMPAGDMDSQLYKARTLELIGRRDDALATLQQCLSRGATRFQIETTPDLQSLITDPRFRSTAV